MSLFGRGGNIHSAAAKVKGMTLEQVKEKLNYILIPTNLLSEDCGLVLSLKKNWN